MTVLHRDNYGDGSEYWPMVLERSGDNTFLLYQETSGGDPYAEGQETVVFDRRIAVMLARAILKSEGIKCD